MNREFLKELGFEKDVIDKVMVEHGKAVQDVKTNLATVEQELAGVNEQLTQRDADIAEIKKGAGNNAELTQQLADLEAKYKGENETLMSSLTQTKLDHAVELALMGAEAKNPKAVKALLDMELVKTTDKGLNGLEEQLTALKESDSYLFKEVTPEPPGGPTPKKIVVPGNPSPKAGDPPKTWREKAKENYVKAKETTE